MERTLSKNEAKVVLELSWRGQQTVKLADIQALLVCSPAYARFMAHQLAKKAWLERLCSGLYMLIPAERGREGIGDTNPLTVGGVLVTPYFFSYGTACTHHGLTEQVFAEVYLACRVEHRPLTIRGKRFVFAHLPESKFYGFEETTVLGQKVLMATKERAIVDALERPEHAGGIGEVSRMVQRSAGRFDWPRLIEYLRLWGESALVQRLGFFLDLHQVELTPSVRSDLLALVRPHNKVHLGPRAEWGTTGKLAQPWHIIENVPEEVLIDARLRGLRRFKFPSSHAA